MCGQAKRRTFSKQAHGRSLFGKWRQFGRWNGGQGPVLSSPSGIQRSFVSRLNQILAIKELIKATGCTTQPLCCDLASVTLAYLKVPNLQIKSCSLWQVRTAAIFISRIKVTSSFHPVKPLSRDSDRAANRAQSRPPAFLNHTFFSSHGHRRFGTSRSPNILW